MNKARIAALEAADGHLKAALAALREAAIQGGHTEFMRTGVEGLRGRLARAIEAERRG